MESSVPSTIPTNIAVLFQIPFKNLNESKVIANTAKANANEFGSTASNLLSVIHFIPTGNSEIPITITTVPVTTLGKNLINFSNTGASNIQNNPATITEPNTVCIATCESLYDEAIAVIPATAAKLVPSITGILAPTIFPIPTLCMSVPIPAINKQAFIKKTILA